MVDLTPPVLNSISGISDTTPNPGAKVRFTVLAADNTGGGGIDDVRLFYQGSHSTNPISFSATPRFSADGRTGSFNLARDIQPGDYTLLKIEVTDLAFPSNETQYFPDGTLRIVSANGTVTTGTHTLRGKN